MAEVISMCGQMVPASEPDTDTIWLLEDILERAKAGEIVGVYIAALHHDATASWSRAGMVGPYSFLGALTAAQADLIAMMGEG